MEEVEHIPGSVTASEDVGHQAPRSAGKVRPVRVQLSRAKGFRLQEVSRSLNGLPCVKVDRSTRWGNPFTLATLRAEGIGGTTVLLLAECVGRFRAALSFNLPISVGDVQRELRGKNLACWCRPGAPCHADVLLEIANAPDQSVGRESDDAAPERTTGPGSTTS